MYPTEVTEEKTKAEEAKRLEIAKMSMMASVRQHDDHQDDNFHRVNSQFHSINNSTSGSISRDNNSDLQAEAEDDDDDKSLQ